MRWLRFLTLLVAGLLVAFCLSCTRAALDSDSPAATDPAAPPATVIAPDEETPASPAPLPPETQQLVASVGPDGLYNPPRGDVRLAVISDLNAAYGSTDYDPEVDKAIALLPFWQPDMVVCSGDMVAGQDLSLGLDQIKAMWAAFDEHVGTPLRQAQLPYGFTVGNHDASSALGVNNKFLFQKERDLAAEYWQNPAHDPGIEFVDRYEFPFYYSFKYGDIFFLAWDGSSSHIPDEQLAWVEKALASDAAQNAKIRILLGHLPLYAVAVGRNQPGDVMDNADKLHALLERYNVHTYISGHHHAYYPGKSGNLQLLHMGIIGSGPRPLVDSQLPPWKAMTVIDIDFETPELTRYTTYDMQTLAEIKYEDLPRFLLGHNGRVLRRDVDPNSLTASEKATCEQRLGAAKCAA
ncbi:MAG: metallophosphoesterase [Spirulinaceae cyanobacterium SM2_1_0]|nr:metallophosphoesterase [Spirulinaceae cyanobacterium SM2_1_0]